MYYIYDLTIPANTSKSEPVSLICKVTHGTITKVSIGFPPGPKGLAHLTINRFEHQVWPTNPESNFAWDNYVIEFSSEFEILSFPYHLKLYGWNEDDTYSHTITVGFNISRGAYALQRLLRMQMPQDIDQLE